ncbi:MAG: FAD-dependent oxidoreductase [Euryarchaeota archaeon]|nr:FAD-dependent oxidoreductase [Euryarchaeota archaeon]
MAREIIIIGSGAAGMTAASSARATDASARITVFTEDSDIAYSPCVIPWVLEGMSSWEDIVMHTPGFYREERDIDVRTGIRVEAVDGEGRTVTAGGETYRYDALVIAAGGRVFVPPIQGVGLEGVFQVRTINDGRRIEAALKDARKVVIAGAGVIGLELALAFTALGKEVTVVEMMDQVIPRIADRDMAAPVQAYLEEKGIRFVMNAPVQAILGEDRVTGVRAGGAEHACDMVVLATGVRANLDLVTQLGLDVGQLGGAVVAPTMQAYRRGRLVPDVFLAGDLVQSESAVMPGPTMSQLGSSAVKEGRVAGINAAGGKALSGPVASPWVSVIGDLQIAGTGLSQGLASWYGIETVSGKAAGSTRARYYPGGTPLTVKISADRVSRRIVGAQIIAGEDATGRINWLTAAVVEGVTADDFLVRAENAYCPPASMVQDVAIKAAEDLCRRLNQ